jgi:hypothetical protein
MQFRQLDDTGVSKGRCDRNLLLFGCSTNVNWVSGSSRATPFLDLFVVFADGTTAMLPYTEAATTNCIGNM